MTDNPDTPDTSDHPAVPDTTPTRRTHPTGSGHGERQEPSTTRFRRLADEITRHRGDLNNRLRDA